MNLSEELDTWLIQLQGILRVELVLHQALAQLTQEGRQQCSVVSVTKNAPEYLLQRGLTIKTVAKLFPKAG